MCELNPSHGEGADVLTSGEGGTLVAKRNGNGNGCQFSGILKVFRLLCLFVFSNAAEVANIFQVRAFMFYVVRHLVAEIQQIHKTEDVESAFNSHKY